MGKQRGVECSRAITSAKPPTAPQKAPKGAKQAHAPKKAAPKPKHQPKQHVKASAHKAPHKDKPIDQMKNVHANRTHTRIANREHNWSRSSSHERAWSRNREHMKIAIYFHCGGLNLHPPEKS